MATAIKKLKKKFVKEKGKKTDEKSREEEEKEAQSKTSSSTTKKDRDGKEFTSLPDVVNDAPNGKAPMSLPSTLGQGPYGSVTGLDMKSAHSKSSQAAGPAADAAPTNEAHASGSDHQVSADEESHINDKHDATFIDVGEPPNPEGVSSNSYVSSSAVSNNQGLNLSDDVRAPPRTNSEASRGGVTSNESPHSQEGNLADPANVDGIVPPAPNGGASSYRAGFMGHESSHSGAGNLADPALASGQVLLSSPAHVDEMVYPDPNSAASGEIGTRSESPHAQEINPADPAHADRVVPPDPDGEASENCLVGSESHHSQELNNATNADRREASGDEISTSGRNLQPNQAIDTASAGGNTEVPYLNHGTTVPDTADAATAAPTATATTGAPPNPADIANRGIATNSGSHSGQEPVAEPVAEAEEPLQSMPHAPVQEETEEGTTHDETTQQEAEANSYDHWFVSDLENKDKLFLEDKLAGELDRTSHRVIKTWEHLSCTDEVNAPLETRLQCKLNSENSCTLMLIDFLAVEKGDKTVGDLVAALKADAVKRHDVVKIITDAHPDAEHSTEKISDFVASDANRELIKKMATKLDQETRVIGYWKNLGQQFQISSEKLKEIESGQFNPTLALMEYLYSKQADLKVKKFYEEVKKLNRNDVLKKLDPIFAAHSEERMKNVIELESDVMRSICVCFNNPNRVLKNWRNLANAFNVPRDIYKDFNPVEPKRPTILLLEWIYANKPELTLGQLCNALQHIDRNDVERDIRKYFEQQQLTTNGINSDQN